MAAHPAEARSPQAAIRAAQLAAIRAAQLAEAARSIGHSPISIAAPDNCEPPLTVELVRIEPRQIGERDWVIRRPRRDALTGIPTEFEQPPRTLDQAAFALAPAGAKPGVTLQRFDVAVTERHGVIELVVRHVFTAASQALHLGPRGSIVR